MVIKRNVFKLMIEKYPELNYLPDGPPAIHSATFTDASLIA
jgi:hypothetical protein